MNQKTFFLQITLVIALIPTTLCAMEPTMQATHWTTLKKTNNTKTQSPQDYWTRHGLIQNVEPQQERIQTEESPQDDYWSRLKKTKDNTGDIQSNLDKNLKLNFTKLSPESFHVNQLAFNQKETKDMAEEELQQEIHELSAFRKIKLTGFQNEMHLNTLCQKQRALEQLTTGNNDTLKQHQQGLIEELNKISYPHTQPNTKSSIFALYKLTSLLNVLQKRGWTNKNFKLPQGENIVNVYKKIINKIEDYLEHFNKKCFAQTTNNTLSLLPFEQNSFIDPMDQLDSMCHQLKAKLDSHYNHTGTLKAFHAPAVQEIRYIMGEKH